MKTYSFIGSDKNAGKTTAFTYYYQQLHKRMPAKNHICLTSIGINGEPVDSYENGEKPAIRVFRNTLFITAAEHLAHLTGFYKMHATFVGTVFSKTYVLASALDDYNIILEGPNEKAAILKMKNRLRQINDELFCLIDGSVDRQFLGHPSISDGICFALLLSRRAEQRKKASDLLTALLLEPCNEDIRTLIKDKRNSNTKSLILLNDKEIIYRGEQVPFLDEALRKASLAFKDNPCVLYLNGSLTDSLYDFLAPFPKMSVVLDNYTCYQNISTKEAPDKNFKPKLSVLDNVPLNCLFIKQETNSPMLDIPTHIPIYNLFRDDSHEIRI